jgi:hypothetical protein
MKTSIALFFDGKTFRSLDGREVGRVFRHAGQVHVNLTLPGRSSSVHAKSVNTLVRELNLRGYFVGKPGSF